MPEIVVPGSSGSAEGTIANAQIQRRNSKPSAGRNNKASMISTSIRCFQSYRYHHSAMEDIASQGLRVLALASRRPDAHVELKRLRACRLISSEFTAVSSGVGGDQENKGTDPVETMLGELTREKLEKDFVFFGLVGIYDPSRLECVRAVRACQAASITVYILTGDHTATANTIAKEIGVEPGAPKGAIMALHAMQ